MRLVEGRDSRLNMLRLWGVGIGLRIIEQSLGWDSIALRICKGLGLLCRVLIVLIKAIITIVKDLA